MPKRVLVVDDEPGVRGLLGDLFASEGYLVSVASDGAQGLDRLRVFCPDVVILDLMMPVLSGWSFAEQCRQSDEFRDVPIIAMSAMFDVPHATTALHALGVRACLAKPFDVDVLLSLVTELA
jgi:two-component system alkaline phosphatase synthesis response regulator PhoP